MSKINHQITAGDARVALESLGVANQIIVNSMRPPLWLIMLCSISLGIKTTAMGLMIHNNLWNSIQWGSYILCCLSLVLWIFALRKKGITVRITDINITKTTIISALLICTLILLSRVVYLQTLNLVFPYIAGVLNTLILAFGLHFGLRRNEKQKGEHNE